MIAYDRFQFASPPRTGTTWVLRAAELAGLGTRFKTTVHVPHDRNLSSVKLTIVRHPAEWLASYYRMIRPGLIQVRAVDRFCNLPCANFFQFAEACAGTVPGAVGRMFDAYGADVCLRLEDLPFAFADFLLGLGVSEYDATQCLVLDRMNLGRRLPKIGDSLRSDIIRAERDFCERYEYR